MLDERDVRRILEWELEYLQQQMIAGEGAIVVAGLDGARHAQERLHEQGHSYDGPLIVEVMELQAAYLAAIGAVADAADADEIAQVFDESEEPPEEDGAGA